MAGVPDGAPGEALRLLDGLAGLPVHEHPPAYEAVHAALTDALAGIDRR